jgi:CRISPR-associated protein Cst2
MFVRLTAKILVNVHDLNNEASVGNFTDIRKVKLINESGEVIEAPAVSGNMLKHWHFIYMKKALEEKGYRKFCNYCLNEEAFRIPQDDPRVSGLKTPAEIEEKIISTCAIEDLHGYLYPGRIASRRESLIKFSWLIPVLNSQSEIFTVTHSRVARGVAAEGEAQQIQQQMLFYKQYSSGLYGFSSCLDLAYVGVPFTSRKYVIDDSDRELRMKGALEAFIPLLTGEFGASQCRSLPIIKIQELLAAYSSNSCLPNPTSAIYSNYIDESINIYENFTSISGADVLMMIYPRRGMERKEGKLRVLEYDKPLDMFKHIIKEIEGVFKKK